MSSRTHAAAALIPTHEKPTAAELAPRPPRFPLGRAQASPTIARGGRGTSPVGAALSSQGLGSFTAERRQGEAAPPGRASDQTSSGMVGRAQVGAGRHLLESGLVTRLVSSSGLPGPKPSEQSSGATRDDGRRASARPLETSRSRAEGTARLSSRRAALPPPELVRRAVKGLTQSGTCRRLREEERGSRAEWGGSWTSSTGPSSVEASASPRSDRISRPPPSHDTHTRGRKQATRSGGEIHNLAPAGARGLVA